MKVEGVNQILQISSITAIKTDNKDFLQVLNSTYRTELNGELKDKVQNSYYRVPYDTYKNNIIDIKECSGAEVDTGRYQIWEKIFLPKKIKQILLSKSVGNQY